MQVIITTISLLVAGLFSVTAQAADASRGAQLHGEQCVACHAARFYNNGNDIYTPPCLACKSR
jgi:mono/diheme cytochrome c family protein